MDDDDDWQNCSLSKLKIEQEQTQFQYLLNDCQKWIEVYFQHFLSLEVIEFIFFSLSSFRQFQAKSSLMKTIFANH